MNIARVFLSYAAYQQDKKLAADRLRDFVRTANAHGIRTMVVLVDLPQQMMPDLFEDSAKPRRPGFPLLSSAAGCRQTELPGRWDATSTSRSGAYAAIHATDSCSAQFAVAKYMAVVLHEVEAHARSPSAVSIFPA